MAAQTNLPPTFKDRSAWLIAFGVLLLLLGGLQLLGTLGIAITMPEAMRQQPNQVSLGAVVLILLLYSAVSIWTVVLGVGSIRKKNWARLAIIITSACWLVLGVLTTISSALIMPTVLSQLPAQQKQALPPGFQSGFIMAWLILLAVVLVALPIVFLLVYTRDSVKATCLHYSFAGAAQTNSARNRLPGPIIALMVYAIYSAGSLVVSCFIQTKMLLFGHIFKGWAAVVWFVLSIALQIAIAWFLWKKRKQGWWLTLGWDIFAILSVVVSFLVWRDYAALIRALEVDTYQAVPGIPMQDFFMFIRIWILIFLVAKLWFTYWCKKYFVEMPLPPQPVVDLAESSNIAGADQPFM